MQKKIDTLVQRGTESWTGDQPRQNCDDEMECEHRSTIQMEGRDIKEVENFVYLGATVSTTGGTEEDIKLGGQRKAQGAFCKLKIIWSSSQFHFNNKLRIFKSSVLAVLLHGCETWRMIKSDEV